jgi:hypothetical protein
MDQQTVHRARDGEGHQRLTNVAFPEYDLSRNLQIRFASNSIRNRGESEPHFAEVVFSSERTRV